MNTSTLETHLKELNPDIRVHDNSNDAVWYSTGNEHRTGIYYKDRHICNVQRGEIPEWDQWGNHAVARLPISVDEGQSNPDKSITIEQWFDASQSFYHDLVSLLDGRTEKTVKLGPENQQCHVARSKMGPKDAVCVRFYFMEKTIPHRVQILGWKTVMQFLMQAKIPGVTRKTLEDKFAINLDPKNMQQPGAA